MAERAHQKKKPWSNSGKQESQRFLCPTSLGWVLHIAVEVRSAAALHEKQGRTCKGDIMALPPSIVPLAQWLVEWLQSWRRSQSGELQLTWLGQMCLWSSSRWTLFHGEWKAVPSLGRLLAFLLQQQKRQPSFDIVVTLLSSSGWSTQDSLRFSNTSKPLCIIEWPSWRRQCPSNWNQGQTWVCRCVRETASSWQFWSRTDRNRERARRRIEGGCFSWSELNWGRNMWGWSPCSVGDVLPCESGK